MDNYVGVLTGGGDCPGLNAAIRAVVRRSLQEKIPVMGIHSGWQGLIDGTIKPLTGYSVAGIQYRGGTILGTSRCDPLSEPENLQKIRDNWKKYGLSSLIVIGGNGTLSASMRMWRDEGFPIVGIPKTIDNDIPMVDRTSSAPTTPSGLTRLSPSPRRRSTGYIRRPNRTTG